MHSEQRDLYTASKGLAIRNLVLLTVFVFCKYVYVYPWQYRFCAEIDHSVSCVTFQSDTCNAENYSCIDFFGHNNKLECFLKENN